MSLDWVKVDGKRYESNLQIDISGRHRLVKVDGKRYECNLLYRGTCYCQNNIIIDGDKVIQLEEHEILIDNFIVDLQKNEIKLYDNSGKDGLLETVKDIQSIEIHQSQQNEDVREIIISTKNQDTPVIIEINSKNQIVGYTNNEVVEIGDFFMWNGEYLQRFQAKNLKSIGYECLYNSKKLKEFDAPNVEKIGLGFLFCCTELTKLELPKCKVFLTETVKGVTKDLQKALGDETDDVVLGYLLRPYGALEKLMIIAEGDDKISYYLAKALTTLKLPKTFHNCLIKKQIQSVNPDCEVELIDIPRQSRDKRKIKIPKIQDKTLDSQELAQLDKQNELTTSELSFAQKVIQSLKSLFKDEKENLGDNREE